MVTSTMTVQIDWDFATCITVLQTTSLRGHPVFSALVSPSEKIRLRERAEKKFPQRQLFVTNHNSPYIFEEITCVFLSGSRANAWEDTAGDA